MLSVVGESMRGTAGESLSKILVSVLLSGSYVTITTLSGTETHAPL